ncbi:MAG: response regulator [Hyphomicrobiaceae bacterium]|nr:response regulator [Hyphomicrobiaceae bacterium]
MQLNWTGRRVLVVEDNVIVAMPLIDFLEECGASVIGPVGSVRAALAALADTEAIDAATLDVELGREEVWPVAHALLARGVPFVFATGSTEDDRFPAPLRHIPRFDKPYATTAVAQALQHRLG